MKKEVCEKCKNYINHYALGTRSGVYRVECGHCSLLKGNTNKRSCEFFEEDSKKREKISVEVLREIYRLNNNAKYISQRLKLIKNMLIEINKENKQAKKHN